MLFLNSRINFKFITFLNKIHFIKYLDFFLFYYLKNFSISECKIFYYITVYKNIWPRTSIPEFSFKNPKIHKSFFKFTSPLFFSLNLNLTINTSFLKNNKNLIEKIFVSKFFVFNFFFFYLKTYSFINFFFLHFFDFTFKTPFISFFFKLKNSNKYAFNPFLRSANVKNLINFNLYLL